MTLPGHVHALLAQAVKNNILPLTGRCNLSCVFCSHRHVPAGVEAFDFPPLPWETLDGLLGSLDPRSRIVMGESATRLREGEPFSHPLIRRVLRELRRRYPETPVQITTNGSLLTGDTLRYLSGLQPLELVLSLNSASLKGRRLVMNDPDPSVAVGAASLLGEYGIAFHGSVVAMPHLTGWDDLRDTLTYLERCGAVTVRFFFPGFTRFSPSFLRFTPEQEKHVRSLVEEMQDLLGIPVLPDPPGLSDLTPRVEGVIKGSPAAHAGLKRGDVVLSVNGVRPRSRVEAFNLILKGANPRLTLRDGAGEREAVIGKERGMSSGVTMLYDLDPGQVEEVKRRLKRLDRTLLFTSHAAAPLWEAARAPFSLPGTEITPVPSEFWGGSICCAGLLTVGDFIKQMQRMNPLRPPDAVLLPPDCFDHRGVDLTGRSYLEIRTGGTVLVVR